MSRGSANYSELRRFKRQFDREFGNQRKIDEWIKQVTKHLTARFLTAVMEDTPVYDGVYSDGRLGGSLRRGWVDLEENTSLQISDAEIENYALAFVANINVVKSGNHYEVIINNNVEYASYVNYGHRVVRGGQVVGSAPGHFFKERSEEAVDRVAERIVGNLLLEKLQSAMR
ncbi:MAG: HK97 gp10 family phage protein [Bacillota bacterium]